MKKLLTLALDLVVLAVLTGPAVAQQQKVSCANPPPATTYNTGGTSANNVPLNQCYKNSVGECLYNFAAPGTAGGWNTSCPPAIAGSNCCGWTPSPATSHFDIRKVTGNTPIPGSYVFNVTCTVNGAPYTVTPNPVTVVLPSPGVATVNVPAGALCIVKEVAPTGSWNDPVYTGSGVAVVMGAPWEAKVGPITANGGVVNVANQPKKVDTVRFDIRKVTGNTPIPGSYVFNVTCTGPGGPYTGPNPVTVVLPSPGVTTVNVPAGAICIVTETPPAPAGSWSDPVYTGSSVTVTQGGPLEAKVGPITANGGVVTVANRRKEVPMNRLDIRKITGDTPIPGSYVFNVTCTVNGAPYTVTPNPVTVVLPSPGVTTVNVPAGALCIVTETQPTGSWDPPTYTGSGVAVIMGAPWEAKVGPITTNGSVMVTNRQKVVTGGVCSYQFTANLNVGTQIPSTVGGIAGAPLNPQTNNGTVEKYCYGNSAANCATYGGLYGWGEAMAYAPSNNNDLTGARVQGICPAGFHIPSHLEWARYEYCLESGVAPTGPTPLATFQNQLTGWRGSTAAGVGPGVKMKIPFGSFSPPWTGTNATGFAALPSGSRILTTGVFDSLGYRANYWSATQGSPATRASSVVLDTASSSGRSGRDLTPKDYGLSVRCMQNY
jgi:uncharacterized protein (TIGR02145 family)